MNFSLFKNFLSLVGAEAFTKLITFAAFAYLARLLGAASFGYIEWSAAVLMCASLIVDQGFSSYGAREIAKNPANTARLTAEVVTARFLMAAIGYLAIALFAFLFVNDQTIRLLLLIYGLSLWALPLLLQWVFQGHDRMNLVAVTQIIRQTIFVGIVFAFVKSANNLLLVGVAETVAVTCAALFSVWLYRRDFAEKTRFRPAFSTKLFREGAPIGLSQMFWTVKMFGATLILGLVATAEDTGYFAGAMRILIALHTFVWLYHFNLLPSLSRAWEQGRDKFTEIIANSMRIVLPVSLAVGVVWVLLAPFVMKTVYGQDFLRGGGALQWMAGACVAAAISGHFRFGLIAAGFQSKEMLTSAIGAIVAAVFIPIGYFQAGTSGAAAALCFAEIVVLLCSWLIAKRVLFGVETNNLPLNEARFETLPEATR
jgi:O-antigen/teichoic acid export membrane protein